MHKKNYITFFIILSIVISVILLSLGLISYIKPDFFNFNKIYSIIFLSIGTFIGFISLILIIIIIYIVYFSPGKITFTDDPIDDKNLSIFNTMLLTLYHERIDGKYIYKGSNYRSNGGFYKEFFEPEMKNIPLDIKYLQIEGEREKERDDMNDKLILFVWYLFYKYLQTRFDIKYIKKRLKDTIIYYKSGILNNTEDYIITRLLVKYYNFLLAIFKLKNRNLISEKLYKDIFDDVYKIKSLLESHFLQKDSNNEELITDLFDTYLKNINKEYLKTHRPSKMIYDFFKERGLIMS